MSLERLTRWNEQTEQAELIAYNTEEWKEFKNSLDDLDNMEIMAAINKLAEYEDLQEQNMFLILPCKLGDTVYMIQSKCDSDDVDDSECDNYDCIDCPYANEYIVSSKIVTSMFFIKKFVLEDDKDFILNKTVFLNKEDAELVLKKMRDN